MSRDRLKRLPLPVDLTVAGHRDAHKHAVSLATAAVVNTRVRGSRVCTAFCSGLRSDGLARPQVHCIAIHG